MAFPLPPAFTIEYYDTINDWETRGGQEISPSTTSTRAIPSSYVVKDQCGADAYKKGSHNITVAKLVNCQPVTIASVSTKAFFALGTSTANMAALMTQVGVELSAALGA